ISALGLSFGLSEPSAELFPQSLPTLYASKPSDAIFQAPFGYQPNAKSFYFSSQLDYGFFFGSADANTPLAVSIQIDELAKYPKRSLLLPKDYSKGFCEVNQHHERIVVSFLTGSPYFGSVVHPQ